ncbi:MAG TPA: PAS domain S-box protein, partial [Vicinamibacterales bacterium]|nr:PAS domain S-box protein [Vicinamibacterales bacterium]
RQRGRERAIADGLRLSRLAATQQASVFNGARQLLNTLAELAPLRAVDPRECLDLLPRILLGHPGYLALTVANADGTIFCSTSPRARLMSADARRRVWFERVMQTRAAAVGDYQYSAVTGTPAIVVAHPLLDSAGRVTRMVVAMIDLARLSAVLPNEELQPGASLTLFDRTGTILARFPDGRSWIGHRLPDAGPLERLAAGAPDVTSDAVGVDGVRRLYVTVPVRASLETRLFVGMGIDHDAAFRDSDRIYRSYLWLLGLVSLMGLGAAGLGSHLFVLRPMRSLKTVADRIAAGDLRARTQLAGSAAGLSELGDAVNAMADALDKRERERDRAEEELRDSEDRYRHLFAQNPHPMWVYDAETLAFLEVNDAAIHRYGYARREFLAMRITDIRPPEDVPRVMASVESRRDPLMQSGVWRHRFKSGEVIDVEITSHTLLFGRRHAVVVSAQDITVRNRAEVALAERAALTTVSAEVGAALNRLGDVRAGMQGCAEAIVAHLDLEIAEINLIDPITGAVEVAATAGELDADRRRTLTTREWPLEFGHRSVGRMVVFGRAPLTEGTIAGLTSIAAMIALGVTRHQAEDARRLLATMVAGSDEAIYGTSRDGTVVTWNAGAERLFGYASADIVGRPVKLLYPSDREDELSGLMDRINRGEHIRHLETIRERQDGSLVPVSLTLSPIHDAAGLVIGTSAIARDMTEWHRTAERLRLLARALESTNEMVSVTDTDDRYTFVNAAFLRAYGYTTDEVIGRTPALLQSRHTPAGVLRDILRESRHDGWTGELLHRRRDGTEFFVSLNTSAVRDDSGEIIGLLGVARDITERLRAEEALHDAEERMRFALEASHVGVWEANLKAGTGFWSSTCEAMHGLAPGTFGQTYEAFLDRIHTDDHAEVRERVARAMHQRGSAEMEYRTVWPDGTVRRISLIAHFSFDDRGKPVRAAGVTIDVTERRSLEDQLRQSQKMDAVGQLAGGIAHDFNNLLTVIQGCSGFLSEALPETDQRRADVDEIQRAAERAAALTRQLLAFSRKQILAVRVLHLGDIVGEVTPMLRRLIGEMIELRTAVGNRGLVKTDPGQLQQVIVNLAVNARDAMSQGWRLAIETSDVVLDDAFTRLHPSVQPGPHVLLSVSDTGHGMDAATQKRIFEPFFTTKPLGQGTGLGLATVYGIVKQSGGTIWVESEVGRGTTFKVYLPRTADVEGVEASAVEARAPGGSESVLVIEDEGPVREFVFRVLTRAGYAVHAVANPLKALDYVRVHGAPIDLLLSDVMLPNMSGRVLVTQIEQSHPESKELFMSGYIDHAIVQDGVIEAGTAFLQKPFTADALLRKVREVLEAQGNRVTVAGSGDRSSGRASAG